jgi:lipopolysaccharide/colanic/teichoic acid biosynthesis glycosyltransferase
VLPAWRVLFSALIWKALGAQELVFLGLSPAALDVIEWIGKQPELGLEVAGYLSEDPSPHGDLRRLGGMADLEKVIEDHHPQRIVVSFTEHSGRPAPERLLQLGFAGVAVEDVASTYEAVLARVSARDLLPSQLAFSADLLPRRFSVTLQTVYSLAIGWAIFVVTLPVTLAAALAVRLTSSGPILLREAQVGMNGVAFHAYRFRTAYVGHAGLTLVGCWLRRFRLDELPRLLNVLRGEMALVGPRAEKLEMAAALSAMIPWYVQRHSVKPGFTGWAQINHERAGVIDDTLTQLEYDLYYVKNLAPALDAYILLYTLRKALAIGVT